MLNIDTTRYSTVIKAFMDRYPEAIARLDKHSQTGPVGQWCTNASLLSAINFSLRLDNTELLGFHDGPRNMWASADTLTLVEELAVRRVLRFQVAVVRPPSMFSRLFSRMLGRRNTG